MIYPVKILKKEIEERQFLVDAQQLALNEGGLSRSTERFILCDMESSKKEIEQLKAAICILEGQTRLPYSYNFASKR